MALRRLGLQLFPVSPSVLIGCTRGLGKNTYGIVQGVVYTVKRVDEANLTLELNDEHKKNDAVQDLERR